MINWLRERSGKGGVNQSSSYGSVPLKQGGTSNVNSGNFGSGQQQSSSMSKPQTNTNTKKKPDPESEEGSEEDEEDDYIDDLPQTKLQAKKVQRSSVSAEAYGLWNKKGAFKPRVIPKNEEAKKRINQRLSQAFMFSALDENERNIVIDAMEEKKYQLNLFPLDLFSAYPLEKEIGLLNKGKTAMNSTLSMMVILIALRNSQGINSRNILKLTCLVNPSESLHYSITRQERPAFKRKPIRYCSRWIVKPLIIS